MPEWAQDYLAWWKVELNLNAWTIQPKVSSHPGGGENNLGMCDANPNIWHATITLRDDIPEKRTEDNGDACDGWERTIIHELLHVSHSSVDNVLTVIASPELSKSAERIVDEVYRAAMEQYIHNMAYILWRLKNTSDDSEGYYIDDVLIGAYHSFGIMESDRKNALQDEARKWGDIFGVRWHDGRKPFSDV